MNAAAPSRTFGPNLAAPHAERRHVGASRRQRGMHGFPFGQSPWPLLAFEETPKTYQQVDGCEPFWGELVLGWLWKKHRKLVRVFRLYIMSHKLTLKETSLWSTRTGHHHVGPKGKTKKDNWN